MSYPPASVGSITAGMAAVAIEPPAHPTVVPVANFNAEADADALRHAMKHIIGNDDKQIISVLTKRSAKQRLQIALMYKTMFGRDLRDDLKSNLHGNFEELCCSLLYDNAQFDAHSLRKAMKGAGTDEKTLIEILCTRSNHEIADIKVAYHQMFTRDLEHDVVSETSGCFKRLLVSCIQGNRQEGIPVDFAKAEAEAHELHSAGEKRWGTDETCFNRIICLRSFPQLRATFAAYRHISQYDIVRSIEHEMSGDVKEAFKAVAMCVVDKPKYFAERLYKSMKGMGTDDETLIRLVVSRSEIDMVEIKEAFFNAYNKSLAKMIADDCSGDYERALLELVGK